MHLPKEKILFNSPFKKELKTLLDYAEKALNERQPIWTPPGPKFSDPFAAAV